MTKKKKTKPKSTPAAKSKVAEGQKRSLPKKDVILCGALFVWNEYNWVLETPSANLVLIEQPSGYRVSVETETPDDDYDTQLRLNPEDAVASAFAYVVEGATLAHADMIRASRAMAEAKSRLDYYTRLRQELNL